MKELRLVWKNNSPVIMQRGLRMPQFEIVEIKATDCQESFQIGELNATTDVFWAKVDTTELVI